VKVPLSQRLRLNQRLSQKPLRLQLSHRLRVKVLLSQRLRLNQRLNQEPLRLDRDHKGDRAMVGKESLLVVVVVVVGEGVESLADKVSTITVKKNSRPNFRTIPNNSKQNHAL
jgi:hypothetical protein